MLLCLILGLVRFYHRGEKCEKRGSTRGRRGSKKRKKRLKEGEGEAQRSRKRGQKPPKPKPKAAKAQAKSRESPRRSRRAREAAKTPVLGGFPPSFRQFPCPASGSSSAQPHHTIKGNEEQQPHSQPHPALQGRHSVVRTGENGYSSVITSAASRIACSSASESLVRGMSMSGVHSPRVCIITFSAVRDWPSERPAWYSFAISFVSS